jgi:sensitive to high expression protein 9
VRSVPPDPDPQVAQPVVEESPSEATQPPLVEEPLASSSRPGSELKERIRQWTDKSAIVVRTRADEFTSSTKSTLSQLGLHLNKMTGYEEIEALKRQVVEQGVYVVFGIRLTTYLFFTL